MKLLFEYNANPTLTTSKGKSVLDLAVHTKNDEILKIVLKNIPQEKEFSDSKDCNVCYGLKNGVFAFLPCGHAKTCQLCCIKIIEDSRKCPACRCSVQKYQKIYL